jgi:hypothetical protein
MGMVTIEESGDEKSIVTPDLRLRFVRLEDRWTHAIDLRPGPWQTVATAIEWSSEDDSSVIRPTYQEVHFQADGEVVTALAVGHAGSHHFSASFRVTFRAYRIPHFQMASILQDRSESRIEIDVADRTRSQENMEVCYQVRKAVASSLLIDPNYVSVPDPNDKLAEIESHAQQLEFQRLEDERAEREGFVSGCRSVSWEPAIPNQYDFAIFAAPKPSASRLILVEEPLSGDWQVKVTPAGPSNQGTVRFKYDWEFARVNVIELAVGSNPDPPWSLTGC